MTKPIRILHVVVNMERGGAETLIMNLYRNVDRNKVQFDFLTCKDGIFDGEIEKLGGIVHRIPYVTDVGVIGYIKELNDFFSNHPYTIVHSHMDKMSGFVLRSAKKAGIPHTIAHSHNTSSEGTLAAKVFKTIAGSLILKSATELLSCSKAASQWLFQSRASSAKILKNGIDLERFSYSDNKRNLLRGELGFSRNDILLGHVGRFYKQKNHHFLIRVFYQVQKSNPLAKLVLVGEGELKNEIKQLVQQLGIKEKVFFLGSRGDVNDLLQAFDLFVFPSLHEGLPVTLIEAQGAGLPCFISDKITKEVDMEAGLAQFLPLEEAKWVEALQNSNFPNRENTAFELKAKGYDIKETAKWLESYYLNREERGA